MIEDRSIFSKEVDDYVTVFAVYSTSRTETKTRSDSGFQGDSVDFRLGSMRYLLKVYEFREAQGRFNHFLSKAYTLFARCPGPTFAFRY